MSTKKAGWDFEEGEPIVPGRLAVQRLGGGIRAEAWVCWDERLHSLVVAKILRPSHVSDESARAALAREANVLGVLQHPAIVRSFGALLDGPRPHLVLESLDGPRLSTLIRRYGPLAPEQLVPLGLELANALAFMHDAGYVHLDVKPRNVIMAAAPRLIDLGLVRTLAELSQLTTPIGTTAYMAPEQARAETISQAGPPADVWALGALLYVAATGGAPSALGPARPPAALEQRVPGDLATLVIACLADQPAQRPAAEELAEALQGMLPGARKVARRRLRTRMR